MFASSARRFAAGALRAPAWRLPARRSSSTLLASPARPVMAQEASRLPFRLSRFAAAAARRQFSEKAAKRPTSKPLLPRPPDKRHTPVTWASMALAIFVSGGLVVFYNSEKERRQNESAMASQTKTVGKALIGGPWSLFDAEGKLRTDADFRGKFLFVYFGFTKCPDICPNELVKIGKIFNALEADPDVKGHIKPIFISIDPRRDTVAQLREYRQDFHPAFTWLTGAPEQVNAAAKVDVTTDEDDDDGYSVDHTIVTYLMGPDGEFCDMFTSGVDAKETIERIKKHVTAVA